MILNIVIMSDRNHCLLCEITYPFRKTDYCIDRFNHVYSFIVTFIVIGIYLHIESEKLF